MSDADFIAMLVSQLGELCAAPPRDGVGEPEVGTGGADTEPSLVVEDEESKGGKE